MSIICSRPGWRNEALPVSVHKRGDEGETMKREVYREGGRVAGELRAASRKMARAYAGSTATATDKTLSFAPRRKCRPELPAREAPPSIECPEIPGAAIQLARKIQLEETCWSLRLRARKLRCYLPAATMNFDGSFSPAELSAGTTLICIMQFTRSTFPTCAR